MGLLSFFQRKNKPAASPAPQASAVDVAQLEQLRVRARHRLMGALVLVSAAVVVLPRVFDSPPRPLSAGPGVKIDMVGRGGGEASSSPLVAAVASAPASAAAPATMPATTVVPTKTMVSTAVPSAASTALFPAVPPRSPLVAASRPSTVPAPLQRSPKADAARAQALLEGREEKKRDDKKHDDKKDEKKHEASALAKAPETATRFFVQVGAFEQPGAAHDMRQRVDKLGLKAHEQELKTSSGRRIRVRVGPYASREEAHAVMARMRASGLQPAIMVQ